MKRIFSFLLASVITASAVNPDWSITEHNPVGAGTATCLGTDYSNGSTWTQTSSFQGTTVSGGNSVTETFPNPGGASGVTLAFRLRWLLADGSKCTNGMGPYVSGTAHNDDVTLPLATCYSNLQWHVKNNNVDSKLFKVVIIGNDGLPHNDYGGFTLGSYAQTIDPGQTYSPFVPNVPCDIVYRLDVAVVDYTGSVADGTATNQTVPLGIRPTLTSSADPYNEQTAITGSYQSNILWSVTNSGDLTGVISAIKTSGSVLFDVTAKGISQAHGDAIRLHDDLVNVQTAINNKPVGTNPVVLNMTNLVSVTVTNPPMVFPTNMNFDSTALASSITNMANQISSTLASNGLAMTDLFSNLTDITNADIASETTLSGISNLLAGAFGGGTNGGTFSISNVSTETTLRGMSNLLSSLLNATNPNVGIGVSLASTNAAAAEAAADSAEGDYGVSGFISQITPSLPGDASVPSMTMNFCGQTIDLDPNHAFPSISPMCLLGWRIMLVLAFIFEVARMFWKLVQIKASTETGGVPDLDVAGFNGLGAAMALVVPVTFIVLFSVGMAYLFSNLGVSITEAMNISAWTSSMGSIGYYLLASFFPVNLFFTLIFTRITLSFTLAKIVALATDASRFLWGK